MGVCIFAVSRRHFVLIIMEFFALKVGRNHRKQAHFGEGGNGCLSASADADDCDVEPFVSALCHDCFTRGNIIGASAANEPFVKSPLCFCGQDVFFFFF